MRCYAKLVHFFWPFIEIKPEEEEKQEEKFAEEKFSILSFAPSKNCDKALEESIRLAEAEEQRRIRSDQKASIYLLVVAALLPLIGNFASIVWDEKVSNTLMIVSVIPLLASVFYVLAAGCWAFCVLKVSVTYRIGISDVVKCWKRPNPTLEITKETLKCTLFNKSNINKKVTSLKMSHAFLVRALVAFAIFLLSNIVFHTWGNFLYVIVNQLKAWLCLSLCQHGP